MGAIGQAEVVVLPGHDSAPLDLPAEEFQQGGALVNTLLLVQ
jgi:hypothetical protein